MHTKQEETLLPDYIQFCTRCPKCIANLCFPESPTSYSSINIRCPICAELFFQDVPQNRPHYNCINIEDTASFNATSPVLAQNAKNILSEKTSSTLSHLLDDPRCRPATQREEKFYILEEKINFLIGLVILIALPIGLFFAIINMISWITLLIWPFFLGFKYVFSKFISGSIFRSNWRNKPTGEVCHFLVVNTKSDSIYKVPFSLKYDIDSIVLLEVNKQKVI